MNITSDANMEWKEQGGWMLKPGQPQGQPRAPAEGTCPPEATEVFKTAVSSSHAATGARPYCSPEGSPDFYKSGSTLHPSTCGSRIKAGNSAPLRHSTKTRLFTVADSVLYVEERRLLDRQEEIQEVKQLDEWKPAVDIFSAALEALDDKAS